MGWHWRLVRQCDERQHWQKAAGGTLPSTVARALEPMPARLDNDTTITSAQAEYDTLRFVSGETACPYLPGLSLRTEAYQAAGLDPASHERWMSLGFRRSGHVVYRPRCRGCQACVPLRVCVNAFRRTRSMRRVWQRNADVRVSHIDLSPTPEKFDLFCRYLESQHDGLMSRSYESFLDFLYDSPTDSGEFEYRVGDRLVGVGVIDRCPGGLSSVYMYFDPAWGHRSLGTYSILWEIDHCRRHDLPYYYLGYYVAGSRTMEYKARFKPHEILGPDGCWVPAPE